MKKYRIIEYLTVILLITLIFWFMSSDSEANTKTSLPTIANHTESKTEPELISLGEFKISYYCGEPYYHICNDGTPETATGSIPEAGRTIAVDPTVIPYGTEVIINGHTYIAEDCGGSIKENRIDIFCDTHQEALEKGIDYYEVFIIATE